jgi:signal transduction histidine kinase
MAIQFQLVKRNRGLKLVVISFFVLLISLLHYKTAIYKSFSHELFARFYYLPIFLAALWFGLRGGLLASICVTLVYMPHLWMGWAERGDVFWDKLLEVALFNIAGPSIGALADMERRQSLQNQELQILASMGEAAAYVAHEIKNMIIPIRGYLRRIRGICTTNGEVSSYVVTIEQETARLEKLTTGMLAFARQAPPQRKDVEVSFLLEDACSEVKGDFQERGIQLVCHCKEVSQASVDTDRIRQALVNLLQNALHASPKGATVKVVAQNNSGLLLISVEDEGEGIPKELIEKALLPFFTTKPKGTGLGLPITSRIVREHGGELKLERLQGKGTRVTLEIPLSEAMVAQTPDAGPI